MVCSRVAVVLLALGFAAAGAQDDGKRVLPVAPPLAPPASSPVAKPTDPPLAAETGDILMTPQEKIKLLSSIDTVMAFVSRDSGLPAVPHVKRRVLGRAEVTAYLVKGFDEDESAKRLQRSAIVLKKFGMLDRGFDLRPFLLALLTEQIAGFYDSKTKYVNLLNWVPADQQLPVMAHELTHACQDQAVGLEKWSSNGFKGVSKTAAEDNARVETDELETARQAVTEGQAMVTFVDYSIKSTGKTLKDLPEAGDRLRQAASDPSGSPMMSRAPLVLQRTLLFPYGDGLGFEQAVLLKRGTEGAFRGVLATPPSSSYEIMTPSAYLAHAPVPVLRMPNVHPLLDGQYEPYDVGVMGELDVEMLTTLYGGEELGNALKTEWDGGVYYAAQRRSATPAEKLTTGSLGLVYFSRWKTERAARKFAEVYAAQLPRQYEHLKERTADESGPDDRVYTTAEGDVVVTLTGREVMVSESFGVKDARALTQAFVEAQGTGPVREALGPPASELGMGWVQGLASFGMLKAGYTHLR